MDKEPASGRTEKKHIGSDLVIPTAGLVFTIYYFISIKDSPWTAQVSALFVGIILIALVLVFAVKAGLSVVRGEADLGMQRLLEKRAFLPKRLMLLTLTVGYIVVIQWGGFTLTTFIFLALAMTLLSDARNVKRVVLLSLTLALGGWLLFVVAFGTRFPAGPFENLMKQVM